MEKVSFDIIISLKDKCTDAIKKVTKAFKEVREEQKAAQKGVESFSDKIMGINAINLNAFIDVVNKIGTALSGTTDKGMSFGQGMADLSAITGLVGKDLEQLEANARKFGKESGLGAETAARAYTILASQIDVADIGMEGLNTLQEKSITLAQASGMSLDASAEALAGTVNQFGLGADAAERVINVLAAGSKYGAAEINDLTQSFKVTGSAASAMGLSVEETAGALEILSKANLKGSEAGTALRNIILKLNTELGIDLGETSLGTALEALKPKLTDATYLSKVFGMENIAAAQFLIQNASAVDEMTAQLTGTNTAQEQAAVRTQTTAQKLAELRAQVDDVKIGIANATGGAAPWVALLSENAEMVSLVYAGGKQLVQGYHTLNAVVLKLTQSTLMQNVATKAAAAATKLWTAAQAALNAVMNGNPIAIAVTAIVALGAAVYACYQNFEGFRNVCDAVWEAVKSVASAVWDALVKAFEKASAVIKEAWGWVKRFFGIEDEADAAAVAESINEETKAIENNTTAKKKNLQLNFNTGSDNKGGTPTTGKEVGQKGSLSWLDNAIGEKEKAFSLAIDNQSRIQIQKELDELLKEKRTIELDMEFGKGLTDEKQSKDLADIKGSFKEMAKMPKIAPLEGVTEGNKDLTKTQKGLEGVASIFGSLGSIAGKSGNDFLSATMASLGSIAQMIAQLSAMATAQGVASASKLPFPANIAAIATVVATIASVFANLPKFAAGGIAYGPTIGLFGEYAGASHNPEVVAPLNRLKSLLGTTDNGTGGKVRFEIEARKLVGILERENNLSRRS